MTATSSPNRTRQALIGAGVGLLLGLLTFIVLIGLAVLAYFALLVGLIVTTPAPALFWLLGGLASLQVLLGAWVGYVTTGEKRTLTKNLRRAYGLLLLVLMLTSPLYICPLMQGPMS